MGVWLSHMNGILNSIDNMSEVFNALSIQLMSQGLGCVISSEIENFLAQINKKYLLA